MLQNKDIKKISELKNDFTHSWYEPDFLMKSLKKFSFSNLCKCLFPLKMRGYNFNAVFSILISLPFLRIKSINNMIDSPLYKHMQMQKDVFYRLKNNVNISWRIILFHFACKFRKIVAKQSASDNDSVKCLIFDDTLLLKTGKLIEGISRVWDHVTNRYVLGFKLLLMGYWDGTSFIPLDFSLHREKGKNANKPFGLSKKEFKKQYRKKRDKESPAYKRIKESDKSKIEIAIEMFWRAISQKFKVDYLLLDSWFTCEAFINATKKVKKQTIHLIGMYKIAKTKFEYKNQSLTHKQLRNKLGKHKRCRKLNLYYKEAVVDYKGTALKIFFSKQGKNGKWKVFICTNIKLSFIQMIEIYQIRWTIEVFFKEAKQLFGLGNCQSQDFDAQIADITMTLIQHMILTLQYRFDNYETKGKLFENIKENILETRLSERLWGLFIELLQIIESLFDGVDESEVIKKIISNDDANRRFMKIIYPNSQEKIVA